MILLLFMGVIANGQILSFEQITPPPPNYSIIADFEAVRYSDLKFGDIDGDGDEDVVIIGLSGTGDRIAQIYKNDSGFGFRRVWSDSVLMGASHGTVHFSDIDGDNDLDILITGIKAGLQSHPSTNLYYNDGSGKYTKDTRNSFIQVAQSAAAFMDIDHDLDQDVIITGRNISGDLQIGLYKNDGTGLFALVTGTPFDSIQYGAIAVADIDNDRDLDMVISGLNSNAERVTKLYINDSIGNFSNTANDTILDGVQDGDVAFQDIDNNGTQDLLIVGENTLNQKIAKLYRNNGTGIFSLDANSALLGTTDADILFEDFNGDTYPDLVTIGWNDTRMYTNDGSGKYTRHLADAVFKSTANGAMGFTDIDGDNDMDFLMTGELSLAGLAEMYYNDGAGNFTFIPGTAIDGGGLMAVADIDGDNDLDVFVMGYNYNFDYHAYIYKNDGKGNYSLWDSTTILSLQNGTADFADLDGDGDQDLLISGGLLTAGNKRTQLYKNDGSGIFTLVSGTPFKQVEYSAIEIADIDGDADLDVLITGSIINGTGNGGHTSLYTNDGSGNFTLVTGITLDYIQKGDVKFGDIDGDDDLDLIMSGLSLYSNANETTLYKNDGNGIFTAVSDPFTDVQLSSIAIGDLDNDGDNDVIVNGWQGSSWGDRCRVYLNNGSGTFTYLTELHGTENGSVLLSDMDNDNDLDVLITGFGSVSSSNGVTKVYTNDGSANFTEIKYLKLDQFRKAKAVIADLNNDNKKDLILSGENISRQYVTKLYQNTTCIANYVNDSIYACDSFVWIDGITYFEDNATAKHTLTNNFGCDSIISLKLKVTSINKSVNQAGTTLSAVSQSGATYQWLNCETDFSEIEGATDNTFKAEKSGQYAVQITRNSCRDTSECKTISPAGIEPINQLYDFSIFPNPANDRLYIETMLLRAEVIIYNNFGQIVLQTTPTSNAINISQLPNGIYYIRVSNTAKSLSPKVFIKQ